LIDPASRWAGMESAMLYVDESRCSGCGDCVEVCPAGAIQLAEGTATIDQERCTQCEACFQACPERAILSVSERSIVPQHDPAQTVAASPGPRGGSLATRVAPALAATLIFIGRELVPRAATYILDTVDRRMSASRADTLQRTTTTLQEELRSESAGRRRRRHRGG
jgi:Fe-S-cluster-containing hydrogenase component 2